MLSELRQKHFLSYLTERKAAQIGELSAAFGVSASTVRRDLQDMEVRGLVRRIHGGVLLPDDDCDVGEAVVLERAAQHAEDKARIGQAAAALVRDNSTIIITSGTTVEAMIPHLAGRVGLTVITNAVNVASALVRRPSIDVIVLGGWLRHSEFSLLGHLTMQAIQDLHADQIFHGIFGIHVEHGLSGAYIQEVQTDRALISAARELIVLADHSKFGRIGRVRLLPIDAIRTVVTDLDTPATDVETLRQRNITVIQAGETP